MPNRHASGDEYRYGFNGMEKDDEVKGEGNHINYEARMQDTRIGRFLSIDPLTKSFPHYSPYQFAGNTPIQAIDLDGAEEYHYLAKWDKTSGKIVFKLEKEKTVLKRRFLWWTWTPSEEHTVVFQNSDGGKTEFVFTPRGKLVQLEGPTAPGTILNTAASFRKFVSNSTKIKYQDEETAEHAFGAAFISEGAEDAITAANALIVGGQFYTPKAGRTKTPVEKKSATITRINNEELNVYRGGTDFTLKPGEYKVTPNGKYPARGLSVNADPTKVESYGGAKKIVSIPNELQIIHTPSKTNPKHCDIIPKDTKISHEDFQKLLNQIKVE